MRNAWNRCRTLTDHRLTWIVVIAATLLVEFVVFVRKPFTELPLYVWGADRVLHGQPLYQVGERGFTYPAIFALPFIPFVYLPGILHRSVWFLINMGALAGIVAVIQARLRPMIRSRPPLWCFWLLTALLAGRHIITVLENQSHDLLVFLCAALAIDASCRLREKTAGFLAGLGAALKCTPLLFAPMFLWQRRGRALGVLLAATVGFTLLPDLLFPARDGSSWTVTWYETYIKTVRPGDSPSVARAWGYGILNQSLAGTCQRLFLPIADIGPGRPDVCLLPLGPTALRLVTLACQLAVVIWLWWITRPGLACGLGETDVRLRRLGEGAALVTAMVLLSPTSIKTHFCVLLLPLAYCLAYVLYRRRDPAVLAALFINFTFGTLTVRGILQEAPADIILGYGSLTWSACALLLATGRILLQREAAAAAPPQTPPVPLPAAA
jgi:hypothetical protein